MAQFSVNRFRVVILGASGTVGELAGWIELRNNATPTGYVYLHNRADSLALPGDNLSSNGTYVVMHQRTKYLESMLAILKGPKPLTISFNNGSSILMTPISANFDPTEAVEDPGSTPPDKNVLEDILAALLTEDKV